VGTVNGGDANDGGEETMSETNNELPTDTRKKVGPVVEWRGNVLYVDEVIGGKVFLCVFSKEDLYYSMFVSGSDKVFNNSPAPRDEAMAWCEEQLGVKSGL